MTMTSARTALAAVAATPFVLGLAASPASAAPERYGPYQLNFTGALAYSTGAPDALPLGVNDWSCRTTSVNPDPVVLVHGTFSNHYTSFARMAPALKAAGHCLYSFNYGTDGSSLIAQLPGVYGTTGLESNAGELSAFMATVRQRTGSDTLDLVGWSQGGTIISDVLKEEGGNGVDHVVTLGATHHGTTLSGLGTFAREVAGEEPIGASLGQAAVDQIRGSAYMQDLTSTPDTVPGVDYTVIGTRYDEVSTPYQATFLEEGSGSEVDNITLQRGCAIDLSDHLSMVYSPRAIDLTNRALSSRWTFVRCAPNAPIL
ncbi:alpha/beta fold hydrolase [Marihabitans asiaticum]|uniref:Lipase (Class 2) n=1 Tax=Marihabitans asiaticum TaxID=415218 RepID=A0A560WEQ3_9MICO|nr:alpha/beta fold hydrolase [Marihabitans asiaticum]TWD15975.1 lipase (class 2) [Marihabitans asiaticum]